MIYSAYMSRNDIQTILTTRIRSTPLELSLQGQVAMGSRRAGFSLHADRWQGVILTFRDKSHSMGQQTAVDTDSCWYLRYAQTSVV